MIKRTFKGDHASIEVTFEWDSGDPSVGIGSGWGEGTGVEIKLAGSSIFILFEVSDAPVEEWPIDDIQLSHDGNFIADLSAAKDDGKPPLAVLPDVCGAVQDTWEQVQAHEALERASEAGWGYEAQISDLEYLLDPDFGISREDPRRADMERELLEARQGRDQAKVEYDRLKADYDRRYGSLQRA